MQMLGSASPGMTAPAAAAEEKEAAAAAAAMDKAMEAAAAAVKEESELRALIYKWDAAIDRLSRWLECAPRGVISPEHMVRKQKALARAKKKRAEAAARHTEWMMAAFQSAQMIMHGGSRPPHLY